MPVQAATARHVEADRVYWREAWSATRVEPNGPRDCGRVQLAGVMHERAGLLRVCQAAARVLGELLGVPSWAARMRDGSRGATGAATALRRTWAGRGGPWGARATMRDWSGRAGSAEAVGRDCPMQLEPDGGSEVAAAEFKASGGHALAFC